MNGNVAETFLAFGDPANHDGPAAGNVQRSTVLKHRSDAVRTYHYDRPARLERDHGLAPCSIGYAMDYARYASLSCMCTAIRDRFS